LKRLLRKQYRNNIRAIVQYGGAANLWSSHLLTTWVHSYKSESQGQMCRDLSSLGDTEGHRCPSGRSLHLSTPSCICIHPLHRNHGQNMWDGGSPLKEVHKQVRSLATNSNINTIQNLLLRAQMCKCLIMVLTMVHTSHLNLLHLLTSSITRWINFHFLNF